MSFSWLVRVYWEDTDGGGVVYHASYLRYLERARTEWLRSLGFSQRALAADPGLVFTVVHVSIDYHRPARLDDALTVICEPATAGPASLLFTQQVHRGESPAGCEAVHAVSRVKGASAPAGEAASPVGAPAQGEVPPDGELLVTAAVRVACVDARTFRPRRLPEFLTRALPLKKQ